MPWLKAETDQPKVSQQQKGLQQPIELQQPRELNSSQKQAEDPENLEHAI